MQNGNQIIIQACPFNGKTCRNGKRDDFEVNPQTQEKFLCAKWICLKGSHPQNNEILDNWMCNEAAIPILLVENANMARQSRASVDKVANEIEKVRKTPIAMISSNPDPYNGLPL
jgi:hypothetical protein